MKRTLLIIAVMFSILVAAAQPVQRSAMPGMQKRKLKASETLYVVNTHHKVCGKTTALIILATGPGGETFTIQVKSRPQTMKFKDKITLRSDRVIWQRKTFMILKFNCVER